MYPRKAHLFALALVLSVVQGQQKPTPPTPTPPTPKPTTPPKPTPPTPNPTGPPTPTPPTPNPTAPPKPTPPTAQPSAPPAPTPPTQAPDTADMEKVNAFIRFSTEGAIYKGEHQKVPSLVGIILNSDKSIKDCAIIYGTANIAAVENKAAKIEQVTKDEIEDKMKSCQAFLSEGDKGDDEGHENGEEKGEDETDEEETAAKWPIYEGTKWCGDGNIADNAEDLGDSERTDQCCRAHDLAQDKIAPKESKHGLTNDRNYPMSTCEDDSDFYRCLKTEGTPEARAVGHKYFDQLSPVCFTLGHPYECKEYFTHAQTLCKEYWFNDQKAKVWQLVYNPRFSADHRDI
ncbi:microtubule-associated protein RP/EB family member 1-like [Ornithodoros turicata]|uniref:microtubule-associated protein RP/EB family member 1-like n=1 Tax=Ornithodoros turicata TaxID=34597 RepID=UPI0031393A6B